MENEPKKNQFNKYIIIVAGVLLVIVSVLLFAILNIMNPAESEATTTQIDAEQTPVNTPIPTYTPAPIVTLPVIVEPTPTVESTMIPLSEEDEVWINLSHLIIRAQPDFTYSKIGNIPYGQKVMGNIDGMWMYTSYDGVAGYIYVGKMKSNDRPCVVYSPSDLQPLD